MTLEEKSGTWNLLGDRYIRHIKLDDLQWNFDLSSYIVVGAPFGGPVALIRDPKKIVAAPTGTKARMYIRSASGVPISEFDWTRANVHSMGWTTQENLCILCEDGTVITFNLHGEELLPPMRLCRDPISLACVFAGGVAVITQRNHVYVLLQNDSEGTQKVIDTILDIEPSCFEVIPAEIAASESVELLIAPCAQDSPKGTIYSGVVIDGRFKITDLKCEMGGTIADMCVSPDGRYVAIYVEQQGLRVVSTDFRTNRTKFEIGDLNESLPHRMLWCGKDIVVMVYLADQFDVELVTTLLLVDATGQKRGGSAYCVLRMDSMDDEEESSRSICCVTECDGLRICTSQKSFFVQYVHKCVEGIYRLSSEEPSSNLFGAFEAYEQQNPTAVQSIRELARIRTESSDGFSSLERAVQDCIEAAGQEIEVHFQKKVLKVASYGKCFCKNFEAEPFVDMCRKLRVLNAIRRPEVGIAMTINQLRALDIHVLIDRLINRHLHLLAYKVCRYLGLKVEKVLVHWACLKVSTSRSSDEDVRNQIVTKLQQCPGVGFAGVASTAFKAGKTQLAIMLLNEEPKAAHQVPLLLEMRKATIALRKAIDSGDTDLVYQVILVLRKEQEDPLKFFKSVAEYPVARDLLVKLYVFTEPKELGIYYTETSQQHLSGFLALQCMLQTWPQTMKDLRNVKTEWEAKVDQVFQWHNKTEACFLARKADHEVHAKCMKQGAELLQDQRVLAKETNDISFVGSTVMDTVRLCFQHGKDKKAEALKARHNISEKKMAWAKLRALCMIGDWDGIDKLGGVGRHASTRVKSSIGWTPYITELLKNGRGEQAKQFVPKLTAIHERMDHWMMLGDINAAIEDAQKDENVEMLQQLRGKATTAATQQTIDRIIQHLTS